MTITTKFSAGDEVYFLQDSGIHKKKVVKVIVEQTAYQPAEHVPLVTYYFDSNGSGRNELYKYESEVAGTVAELIRQLAPKEANPSVNDSDGGVTDDLKRLQAFVRDICNNYDCDSDAHRHNTGGCRVCNARKLLII